MKKPLAGKKAFYAMGQRAAMRGEPQYIRGDQIINCEWAWISFSLGFINTKFSVNFNAKKTNQ